MSIREAETIKHETIGHVLYIYGDLENINPLISNYLCVLKKIKDNEIG